MTSGVSPNTVGFLSLPKELIQQHMVNIHALDLQDIGRLNQVCTFFNRLFGTGEFWQTLYQQDYQLKTTVALARESYRRESHLRPNLINQIYTRTVEGGTLLEPNFLWASPGQLVVSGARCELWNFDSEPQRVQLGSHFSIPAVDDRTVFFGEADGRVKAYDLQTGKWLPLDVQHGSTVYSLALQEDRFFSGGQDGTIKIWDRATGRFLKELPSQNAPVERLEVIGDTVIALYEDLFFEIWDLKTETSYGIDYPALKNFTATDEFLITGSEQAITFYAIANGKVARRIPLHYETLDFLFVMGGMLVAGRGVYIDFWRLDGEAIWDTSTSPYLRTAHLPELPKAMAFLEDTLFLSTGTMLYAYHYLESDDAVLAQIATDLAINSDSARKEETVKRYHRMPLYVQKAIDEKIKLMPPVFQGVQYDRYKRLRVAIERYVDERKEKEVKQ